MGTRADFYVGTGPDAEWLGSITYDGYPDGNPAPIFKAKSLRSYRSAVEKILADPEIRSTRPAEGWPWPWEDSRTTDYAYTWVDGKVKLSGFGERWETLGAHNKRMRSDNPPDRAKLLDHEVRDMSKLKADNSTILAKSGLIFFRG